MQVQQGPGEDSGEGLGAEPGQVQQGSGEGSGEDLGAEPGQVQHGSGEGSGEGLGSFGAEKVPKKVPGSLAAKPSQVQWVQEKAWEALVHSQVRFNRASEKVPEKVWEALVPEKVPEKVWEALVQSQVRFSRVPEKVPDKVPGGFGAEPGQFQQGSAEYSGEGSRKPWCKAKSGSMDSGKVAEVKPGEVHLTHGNLAEVFPELGFPASFRKIYKNKTLRLLGIPHKLI